MTELHTVIQALQKRPPAKRRRPKPDYRQTVASLLGALALLFKAAKDAMNSPVGLGLIDVALIAIAAVLIVFAIDSGIKERKKKEMSEEEEAEEAHRIDLDEWNKHVIGMVTDRIGEIERSQGASAANDSNDETALPPTGNPPIHQMAEGSAFKFDPTLAS